MEINGEKVGLEQDQEFKKKRAGNEDDTAEVEKR